MKIAIGMVASLVLGAAAGTTIAFVHQKDPGPQFERLVSSRGSRPSVGVLPTKPKLGGLQVEGGERFEFGVMDRGEIRAHTFKFLNNTDKEIKLAIGSTTCKCTVGELEDDTIPAGGVGEVNLEWVAKSYEPEFQQSATIETTDPVRPKIVLVVNGQVLQLVQPMPQGITVGDVSYGAMRTETFRIYNFQGDVLKIVGHEFDNDTSAEFFGFQWEPVDIEGDESVPEGAQSAVQCKVVFRPGIPYGNIAQSIRVTTDAERSAVVEVPIFGRIVSDLILAGTGYVESTGVLMLGMVDQDKGKQRVLRLMARRADVNPVELTLKQVDPADVLDVELGEPKSLKDGTVLMFPITIRVKPGARPVNFVGGVGRPRSKIVFDTTHPVVKQMSIDVRFSVLAQ